VQATKEKRPEHGRKKQTTMQGWRKAFFPKGKKPWEKMPNGKPFLARKKKALGKDA